MAEDQLPEELLALATRAAAQHGEPSVLVTRIVLAYEWIVPGQEGDWHLGVLDYPRPTTVATIRATQRRGKVLLGLVIWEAPRGKARATLLDSTARTNLWHGAVRSTKTVTSLQRWVEFIDREAPAGGELVMSGYSQGSVVRNCVLPLQDHYGTDRVKWNPGTGICTILGRRVYVIGAGTITGWRALRGMTCAGIYIDEASLVTEPWWNLALGRISIPGARLFATTNPDAPSHWLHQRWVKRSGELDMALFHLTLDDNPWLSDEYKNALKAEYVGVWYRRYILGLWVAAEGAIWPQLDPERHLVDTLPQLLQPLIAIDYGTVNDFCGLVIGHGTDPVDMVQRLYVAREWRWNSHARQRQLADQEYGARLFTGTGSWQKTGYASPAWQDSSAGELSVGDIDRVVVDPSAANFLAQLRTDGVKRLTGADNRVGVGLRAVSSLLAADRLRIHRSCSDLWDEAIGYSWDDAAAGRGDERPTKQADHGPDALRYGVMARWSLWRNWVKNAPEAPGDG